MDRPKPIARKSLGGSRIDALFSSLHSRLPDGGTATLIRQRGLASSCTSWVSTKCLPQWTSLVALVVQDGRFCRSHDVQEARRSWTHASPPRHAHPCGAGRREKSASDTWCAGAPREPVPGQIQPPHRRSARSSSPTTAARSRWHSEALTSPSRLPPAAPCGVGCTALRDGPGGGERDLSRRHGALYHP